MYLPYDRSVCKLVGKSVKISFSLVLFIYRDEWQFERNGPWAASHPHAELLPRPNCTQPNYSHQENVYLNRNVQTLRLKVTWTISYESTRSSHSEIGVQYPEDVNVEKNLKNQSTSASLYHSLPRTIRFFFFMIWDSQRMVRCLHSLPVFLEILLDTVFSFFSFLIKPFFLFTFFLENILLLSQSCLQYCRIDLCEIIIYDMAELSSSYNGSSGIMTYRIQEPHALY